MVKKESRRKEIKGSLSIFPILGNSLWTMLQEISCIGIGDEVFSGITRVQPNLQRVLK